MTFYPTPYPDVNAVANYFRSRVQAILGAQFVGMYLYGSLALGDFDPQHSDIDFIVVTAGDIDEASFAALRKLHDEFAAGVSPWSRRVEAAYIPQGALNHRTPTTARYPQLETERPLSREPLEIGWVFQRHSLREYGVVVAGPVPHTMIDPIDPGDMRQAVRAITDMWLNDLQHNPSWLDWVRERSAQAFVVLTLCRCLYALDRQTVASKPAAARWAQVALPERWLGLIERAQAGRHQPGQAPVPDLAQTVALIRYTSEKSR